MGRFLNRKKERIPEASFTKPPSAELRPNQTDQDSLPPYDVLDAIVEAYVEEGLDVDAIAAKGFSKPLVKKILTTIDRNEYKRRQAPPGLKDHAEGVRHRAAFTDCSRGFSRRGLVRESSWWMRENRSSISTGFLRCATWEHSSAITWDKYLPDGNAGQKNHRQPFCVSGFARSPSNVFTPVAIGIATSSTIKSGFFFRQMQGHLPVDRRQHHIPFGLQFLLDHPQNQGVVIRDEKGLRHLGILGLMRAPVNFRLKKV